jgi:hypothetical protein
MGEANATRVPSIGRIVHFQKAGGVKLPAIVVKVHSPTTVNLQVFQDGNPPHALEYETSVVQGAAGRSWNWPEQV